MVRSGTDDNILDIFGAGGQAADFDLGCGTCWRQGCGIGAIRLGFVSQIFEYDVFAPVR
jgi:hypothetical protein